ncbi:hypothetical protein K503DRAFT_774292 [Rhizopogon vinicolor AM-OR11-026]|uniref:Uncharacterized protein n=1 Tax=Rhizopogon vinicolor AM-OR11-026 TaxID=1314800 RepID=A0A1B7MPZ4_9AGAM|nr:hypothetical protein K503DRAFT_774292 [Rhizopogon vinicolor AM-OR11-026]
MMLNPDSTKNRVIVIKSSRELGEIQRCAHDYIKTQSLGRAVFGGTVPVHMPSFATLVTGSWAIVCRCIFFL